MSVLKLSLACSLAIAATSSFAGNCYHKRAGDKICVGGYATGYQSDCETPCSTARIPAKADAKKGASATTKKANLEASRKANPAASAAIGKESASSPSK